MSTVDDVRDWVRGHLGRLLGKKPEEIKLDCRLSDYGLDSVDGVLMAGELEDYFGVEVDPGTFIEAPTFESLVVVVAVQLDSKR